MEMDLLTFTGIEFEDIRVFMIDGEPWYVANDVARELGFKSNRSAVSYYVVDPDDMKYLKAEELLCFSQRNIEVPNRGLRVINESGMYALMFAVPMRTKSDNEEVQERIRRAHEFKHLVTHKILPAIRNSGSYHVRPMRRWKDIPASERDYYRNDALTVLRRQYDDAEEILEYAFFGNDIATAIGTITIEQFAKSLSGAYNIGQNQLYDLMRKKAILWPSV